jgi:acetyl-CoA carboxylase biotin carboxyl carrier protein
MKNRKKSANPASGADVGVDFRAVERLLEFMEEHGLEEFEYERGGIRIRLKKPLAPVAFRGAMAPEIHVAGATASGTHPPGAPSHGREGSTEGARPEDQHVIKSPIVGTFYGAPSPGAEPFVKIGDHVESGQVLCIIEAMKLMNEIESDLSGEVMRIFVENGQPVEYGEPLFAIHPNRKK